MRAVTVGDENIVKKLSHSASSFLEHVTLSESLRIRYCPSCGTHLDALVASDPSLFARLADEHRPYQNEWGV
jgi:hypothetical protein